MKVRVEQVRFGVTSCPLRIPFRFGVITLKWAPLCVAEMVITGDAGGRTVGYAADFLAPKWFDKDPAKSARRNIRDLAESAEQAARHVTRRDAPAATVFETWWELYRSQVSGAPEAERLVRGFGVALVERALMDAACRASGIPFFRALREDLFGFRPGSIHASLLDWSLAESLGDEPVTEVDVRHTVGLLDPLHEEDLTGASRAGDGMPETLAEDVERYGLTHFKIKLCGDPDQDLRRLLRVSTVLREKCPGEPRWSLDGNEQYSNLGDLVKTLRSFREHDEGKWMLPGLLHVEQPLARSTSFDADRLEALPELEELAPMILDEADHGLDAFPRALERGYRGVSVKNCKGVFRALINRGLCDRAGKGAFQTSEDLTNVPALSLQQDLATLGSLGLTHSERNGHHYFRGLEHLPEREQDQALERNSDLYRRAGGRPELWIERGRIRFRSVFESGYGNAGAIEMDARTPLSDWLREECA